jgi:hypothetical protein
MSDIFEHLKNITSASVQIIGENARHPHIVNVADVTFGVVGLTSYLGHLPEAAAALTVLWYLGRFAAVISKFLIWLKKILTGDRSV